MLKTYFLFTLGCQMNVSDSERIEAVLEKRGLKPADEKSADLIIVNSCSVRQKPVDRIWGKVRVWSRINPKAKRILTGCILPSDLKKLGEKFDFCFKIENIGQFKTYLTPHNLDEKNKSGSYLEVKPKRKNKRIMYVPIMTGCNNFCSYCVVPYTRGREWSRKPMAVVEEVECLVKKGFKEIMLLGQNVCSYRNPKSKILNPKQIQNLKSKFQKNDFVELLKQLVKILGDFEISFMSPYPKDFSDELIDLIARESKISKQIHLPLQSGDNQILKKMNRYYTTRQYSSLVDKLREKVKNVKISTDIIVGFPGESKKSFQKTVNLAKKCRFVKAYVSIYSSRSGTMAEKKYNDDVPMAEKKKRWLTLDQLINGTN